MSLCNAPCSARSRRRAGWAKRYLSPGEGDDLLGVVPLGVVELEPLRPDGPSGAEEITGGVVEEEDRGVVVASEPPAVDLARLDMNDPSRLQHHRSEVDLVEAFAFRCR